MGRWRLTFTVDLTDEHEMDEHEISTQRATYARMMAHAPPLLPAAIAFRHLFAEDRRPTPTPRRR